MALQEGSHSAYFWKRPRIVAKHPYNVGIFYRRYISIVFLNKLSNVIGLLFVKKSCMKIMLLLCKLSSNIVLFDSLMFLLFHTISSCSFVGRTISDYNWNIPL